MCSWSLATSFAIAYGVEIMYAPFFPHLSTLMMYSPPHHTSLPHHHLGSTSRPLPRAVLVTVRIQTYASKTYASKTYAPPSTSTSPLTHETITMRLPCRPPQSTTHHHPPQFDTHHRNSTPTTSHPLPLAHDHTNGPTRTINQRATSPVTHTSKAHHPAVPTILQVRNAP